MDLCQAAQAAAKATCVFDVGHAAFWLARVGTSITQEHQGYRCGARLVS